MNCPCRTSSNGNKNIIWFTINEIHCTIGRKFIKFYQILLCCISSPSIYSLATNCPTKVDIIADVETTMLNLHENMLNILFQMIAQFVKIKINKNV